MKNAVCFDPCVQQTRASCHVDRQLNYSPRWCECINWVIKTQIKLQTASYYSIMRVLIVPVGPSMRTRRKVSSLPYLETFSTQWVFLVLQMLAGRSWALTTFYLILVSDSKCNLDRLWMYRRGCSVIEHALHSGSKDGSESFNFCL